MFMDANTHTYKHGISPFLGASMWLLEICHMLQLLTVFYMYVSCYLWTLTSYQSLCLYQEQSHDTNFIIHYFFNIWYYRDIFTWYICSISTGVGCCFLAASLNTSTLSFKLNPVAEAIKIHIQNSKALALFGALEGNPELSFHILLMGNYLCFPISLKKIPMNNPIKCVHWTAWEYT